MKSIFGLMATSISKITEFGMKNNPERFKNCHYIQKKRWFDVVRLTHIIGQIPVEMLGHVIGNWKFRIDHINRSYDEHLKDFMLKK